MTTSQSSAERRRLSREARDAFPPMGIYAVRNRASGTLRVASSRNVHGAINRLQFELRLGRHADKALQANWNDDPSQITFDVLELVKQRTDPAFDYAAELKALEEIYAADLCGGAQP
ncbi:GIY-YIG nuclease family protein [Ramlibacter albus]|uniref:GIY-YIG nuclease family protein n=1 Tax=Ramlibacter albus TaxID=2079448 RepID=A0A923MFE7_9BURK|nr:GIY-YIG nuclease family protein [Ramlibacter albus]MBC5768002.1 GIY-YIG nuclease family protein [Ramlibacter albus]